MDSAETQVPEETILRRHPWSVISIVLSLFYAARIFADATNSKLWGVDFGVFHAGGSLIASDGYDAAYDTERFSDVLATDYFTTLADGENVSHFISTPTFGWFAQGLAWLPFTPSLAVWFAVGFALLVPAVRMLSLPTWVAGALLISPMMAINLILGQTGIFVLVLFAGIHLAHRDNKIVLAGLLAGLIIVKPVLALGYGVLWLVQFRTYARAIGVAVLTGVVLSIPTFVGGLGSWQGFLEAMQERADSESRWTQQAASVPEFIKLLFPLSASWVTLASWVVGLGVGLIFMLAAHRRYGHDPEVMSAAAIVATVISSPHLLTYDTMILVIPVAVAYTRGILTGDRGGMLFAIVTAAFVIGPVLYNLQYDILGRGIGSEFPAVMLCVALLVRWDRAESVDDDPAGVDSLAPVLADA